MGNSKEEDVMKEKVWNSKVANYQRNE